MLSEPIASLLAANPSELLIGAKQVANVMTTNDCYHAFLVLTKVGYSKVVVLDAKQHVCGLLSLQQLTERMLTTDRIAPENLVGTPISSVMQTDFKTVCEPLDLEDILHDLIDAAFLPVVDEQRVFKGIITRREVLKRVNSLGHQFDNYYDVVAAVSTE